MVCERIPFEGIQFAKVCSLRKDKVCERNTVCQTDSCRIGCKRAISLTDCYKLTALDNLDLDLHTESEIGVQVGNATYKGMVKDEAADEVAKVAEKVSREMFEICVLCYCDHFFHFLAHHTSCHISL